MKNASSVIAIACIVLACLLAAFPRSNRKEGSWGFTVFVSSESGSADFFLDWERLKREGGDAYGHIDVYCRGWTRAFLNANTVEQFFALDESDSTTLRITITPSPDATKLGLVWNDASAERLVRCLRDAGIEGLDGINTQVMLAELSAGRPFVHVPEGATRMNGKK